MHERYRQTTDRQTDDDILMPVRVRGMGWGYHVSDDDGSYR